MKKENINKKYIFLLLFALFIIELFSSIIIIYLITTGQIRSMLNQKIARVHEDVHYTNGTWSIASYNTDPVLLSKSPLYLITTDGFVIDRRSPIHGFLDTSNFRRLLTYQTIQTITPITQQTRRIYAQPILDKENVIGVVAVSYFNPKTEILPSIDTQLRTTLQHLSSSISVYNGIIDVNRIDERRIPYNVSFAVVDKYNTTLKKTTNVNSIDRIPNFIDPSYVKTQLSSTRERIIQDSQTGEMFLTETDVITNKKGEPLAFITTGQTLSPVTTTLQQYLLWQGLVGIVILLGSYSMITRTFRIQSEKKNAIRPSPHFSFNETKGLLIIDNHEIPIPYATNQFYLLQALFHKPTKRWETDELLKKFGDDDLTKNNRKVYDAMVKINKKVATITSTKLILNQNKTYQLNPQIIFKQ